MDLVRSTPLLCLMIPRQKKIDFSDNTRFTVWIQFGLCMARRHLFQVTKTGASHHDKLFVRS